MLPYIPCAFSQQERLITRWFVDWLVEPAEIARCDDQSLNSDKKQTNIIQIETKETSTNEEKN